MGARIHAEQNVFLVVANGVVTVLPELPLAVACPASSSRSALLSDDQQYCTSPGGPFSGAGASARSSASQGVGRSAAVMLRPGCASAWPFTTIPDLGLTGTGRASIDTNG